jgi:hypothetical protein
MRPMGLLQGLGLLFPEPKPVEVDKKHSGPFMLADLGDFPRSAKAISQVLKGQTRWSVAKSTLRSELEDNVPFDPIGRWYHEGKEYEKDSISDLQDKVREMKPGEALYFRLGVASALSRRPGIDEKLKVALGADYEPVVAYSEAHSGT